MKDSRAELNAADTQSINIRVWHPPYYLFVIVVVVEVVVVVVDVVVVVVVVDFDEKTWYLNMKS